MTLEMTDRQAEELKMALESYLTRLLDEIAHADDRAFRQTLTEQYDRLEQLRLRLDAALEVAETYA